MEFQIRSIELLEFALIPPAPGAPATTNFYFDFNIQHQIDPENKVVAVFSHVIVKAEDQTSNLARLGTLCVYEIKDFEKIVIKQGTTLTLPEEWQEELYVTSVDTTRGIMFSQFKGTPLHYAFFPVIDPRDLQPKTHA
ncbi:MAG: hypothetical protein ACKVTZ_12695 [Bacteroidia bacterium]